MGVHRAHASVVTRYERVCDAELELLQAHDLFFNRVSCNKPIDNDCLLLSNSMRAIHSLSCVEERINDAYSMQRSSLKNLLEGPSGDSNRARRRSPRRRLLS